MYGRMIDLTAFVDNRGGGYRTGEKPWPGAVFACLETY